MILLNAYALHIETVVESVPRSKHTVRALITFSFLFYLNKNMFTVKTQMEYKIILFIWLNLKEKINKKGNCCFLLSLEHQKAPQNTCQQTIVNYMKWFSQYFSKRCKHVRSIYLNSHISCY